MKKILKIISKTQKTSAKGRKYWQTEALLDLPPDHPFNGEVFSGFGREFAAGELVEAFYDDRWQKLKMIKPS